MEVKNVEKKYKTIIEYFDKKTNIEADSGEFKSDDNNDTEICVIRNGDFYKTYIEDINPKLYELINGKTLESSLYLNYDDNCFLVEISTA